MGSQIPNIITALHLTVVQERFEHNLTCEDISLCTYPYQGNEYVEFKSLYTKPLKLSLNHAETNRLVIIEYRHQIKKFIKTVKEAKEVHVNRHTINNPINNAVGWKV